jgi:acyl-CoA reductase-like NAD-dependent aldehyde dehydrogenase
VTAGRTDYDSLFVGGQWDRSSGSERISVVSPHSAQVIGSVPGATTADVESIFEARPTL